MERFENLRLRKIKPGALFDEKKKRNEDIEEFFLTLALVFNDIKGLIILNDTFVKKYERPDPTEPVSSHKGEYNGLRIQLLKVLIGTLHEFFVFLEKNMRTVESKEFREFVERLPVQSKELWGLLVEIACDNNSEQNNNRLRVTLRNIRHAASFHYSGSALAKGFRDRFFNKPTADSSEWAYYSAQVTNFTKTRFFYADAAIEAYMSGLLEEPGNAGETVNEIFEHMATIVRVINDLMSSYHSTKLVV